VEAGDAVIVAPVVYASLVRIWAYAWHFDAQALYGLRALSERDVLDQELLAAFDFP
jgi:hypothetical protein